SIVCLAMLLVACLPPVRYARHGRTREVCRDVPHYEHRIERREGEWTQPMPCDGIDFLGECDQIRVCRAESPNAPAECEVMTHAAYERSRTVAVLVRTDRVCEEVEIAPSHGRSGPASAPSWRGGGGGCPGGVTTSGRCC